MPRRTAPLALLAVLLAAARLGADALPCQPCAGLRLADPSGAEAALVKVGPLEPGTPLFVAWDVPLGGAPTAAPAAAVAKAGGTPWLTLVFATPAPLTGNVERLQGELQAAARVAAEAPAGSYFQVVWRPEGAEAAAFDPRQYAFLLKRAAVALTGARAEARVATAPLPPDPAAIEALYGEEVAAYLELAVLQPAAPEATAAAVAAIGRLDPGRPVAVDALPFPAVPAGTLAAAARLATRGAGLTLFAAPAADPAAFFPLALLAREFAGDLSYDPTSMPSGAEEAWSFVRGKDLALRVIAVSEPGVSEPGAPEAPPAAPGPGEEPETEAAPAPAPPAPDLVLRFPDPELRRPVRFRAAPVRVLPPAGRVVPGGLEVRIPEPGPVEVLGLERTTAAERQGVAEKVIVSSEREIPVEEILRRLQAFEDAQDRRLEHYQATNTTSLRFQLTGTQTVEATLQGPFFASRGGGSDWAWETLYVNGVRWRGKTLPEIPLIQPQKAAAMPLEITFDKKYRYRLRGSEKVDGRDAWIVDFAPAGAAAAGDRLYQGTVWVDRQLYSRLRTRAVQIGLEGEVVSNEETLLYTPVDAMGQAVAWGAEGSFVLPLRALAQQILSVVNTSTVVDRETRLTDVRVNAPDYETARAKVAAEEVTMVRDTPAGLRYLVKDESGQRVVKEGFDRDRLFLAGGVFYDDALDYPLPLAGINYFSFDFRGTGQQMNVFFGGALLTATVAQPRLFGSRFDAGVDVFGIALPLADTNFRGGREFPGEEIEMLPASTSLEIGHPLGSFTRVELQYALRYSKFGRTDNTDPAFVLPSDNFTHSLELGTRWARSGYRLGLAGSFNRRSEWDFWGLPGNPEFDPEAKDFVRWNASASKTWYLPKFQKVSAELDYAAGSDLDRFSKYEFGFFGGTRVHGYQSNRVRATEAKAAHLSYGFEIGEFLRIDALGDLALATDEDTGLDDELLAGVGVGGTFIGPWQTLVNLDVGVPVAGPDDGFVLYLVLLKLFH